VICTEAYGNGYARKQKPGASGSLLWSEREGLNVLEKWLIVNAIDVPTCVIAFFLCAGWSRTVRGKWPSKKKLLFLSAVLVAVLIGVNIFFFVLVYRLGRG
jgi:hypothetical protein